MEPIIRWFRRSTTAIGSRDSGPFLAISLVVGVAVGLGAIWTRESVEEALQAVSEVVADGETWFLLVSVPLDVSAAWWIARRFAPEVSGDGVAEAAAALAVHGGYLSTKSIPLKIVATARERLNEGADEPTAEIEVVRVEGVPPPPDRVEGK